MNMASMLSLSMEILYRELPQRCRGEQPGEKGLLGVGFVDSDFDEDNGDGNADDAYDNNVGDGLDNG